jgi:hypothetical protein
MGAGKTPLLKALGRAEIHDKKLFPGFEEKLDPFDRDRLDVVFSAVAGFHRPRRNQTEE